MCKKNPQKYVSCHNSIPITLKIEKKCKIYVHLKNFFLSPTIERNPHSNKEITEKKTLSII